MNRKTIVLSFVLGGFLAAQADALDLIFDVDHPSPEESAALNQFAYIIKAELPESAVSAIWRPVHIRFADLDGRDDLGDLCRTPEDIRNPDHPDYGKPLHTWGGYSSQKDHWRIDVHQAFLREIVKGPEASASFECRHKTAYKTAVATVIHEIGHILDHTGTYSNSDQYQALMDWTGGLFGPSIKNVLQSRSPDLYEQQDPAESFAVNFEYFLLDPEFACRRGSVWRYMAEQFNYKPSAVDCAPYRQVWLSPAGPWIEVDPSRVVEIRYLFASKGEELASRWGHAMFQFVICPPEGDQTLEECRKHPKDHIVISYRANILDARTIDLKMQWKGLTGQYPSQIFFSLFPTIAREYAEGENRDVVSLPLKLSDKRREMFVNRALEQYWSYVGRYYFLSNNCATEAKDAMRSVVDSNHKFQTTWSLSPLGLYGALEKSGLIDTSVLKFRDDAIREGYLYPSRRKDLENAFAAIRPLLEEKKAAEDAARLIGTNGDPSARDQMYPANACPAPTLASLLTHPLRLPSMLWGQDPVDKFVKCSTPAERRGYLQPEEPEQTNYGIPDSGAVVLLRRAKKLSANIATAKMNASKAEPPSGIERVADNFRTAVDDQERLGWAAVLSVMAQLEKRKQAAALALIERHILHVKQSRLNHEMLAIIDDEKKWPEIAKNDIKTAGELMEKLQPWNQITAGGYGMPDSGVSSLLRQAARLATDLADPTAEQTPFLTAANQAGATRAAERFLAAGDDQEQIGWAAVLFTMAKKAIPEPEVLSHAQVLQFNLALRGLAQKAWRAIEPSHQDLIREIRASDANLVKFKKALKKEREDTDLIAGPDITAVRNSDYGDKTQ